MGEVVKLILSKGADVNSISGQGYTPLHMAVINGHDALVPIMIQGGADLNTADEESLTPLHMAARDGQGEIALMLVKAGANLHATNQEGKTPELLADLFNARSSYLRAGVLANTFKCLDSKKILVILTLGDLANTYRSARIKVLVILTQLILDVGA